MALVKVNHGDCYINTDNITHIQKTETGWRVNFNDESYWSISERDLVDIDNAMWREGRE